MDKSSFLSSLFARLLFFLLLLYDLIWLVYVVILFCVVTQAMLLTRFKSPYFSRLHRHSCLSFKRACISAVALILACFSPNFGLLVAGTYFLLYDPEAIDQVVPNFLRPHFDDLTSTQE